MKYLNSSLFTQVVCTSADLPLREREEWEIKVGAALAVGPARSGAHDVPPLVMYGVTSFRCSFLECDWPSITSGNPNEKSCWAITELSLTPGYTRGLLYCGVENRKARVAVTKGWEKANFTMAFVVKLIAREKYKYTRTITL